MSAFPTHLLEPSTLAAEARSARRAGRRRSLVALLIVFLMIVPPIAIIWLARDSAPADGTLTYPSHWSASGVEIQGAAAPGEGCAGGLREGDVVTDVNGRAVGALPDDRRLELDGPTATYTVMRDDSSCEVSVAIGGYPWLAVIGEHVAVLPLVVLMWVVAGFVFLRRPRDPAAQALFASAVLLPYTGLVFPFGTQVTDVLSGYRLWPLLIGDVAYVLLWGAMLHFALAFPRPVSFLRGGRAAIVAYLVPFLPWVVYAGARSVASAASGTGSGTLERLSYLAALSVPASFFVPPLLAAIVLWQYRHAKDESERRRVRWIVYSLLVTAALYLLLYPIPEALGAPPVSYNWVAVLFLGVPLVFGAAVLQYGLFDLQVLLSRSLLYGALTFLLVVIPAGLGLWVSTSTGNQPWELTRARALNVALATALLIALFLQTLRSRLRRLVSRLVFGSRDDPYEVAAQLGRGLQASPTGGSLLDAIAETVSRTLRLPYVAIELLDAQGVLESYTSGERQGTVQAIPLSHHGEEIGRLLLGSGRRTELFGPADQKLVELLAQQVGLAAQNQLLATRLQRSLERTVSAREEERRRLRRDIHDGLGPMLAAGRVRLEVASQLVSTDPTAASNILNDLATIQQHIIDDVRRLVDGLRPPVLDQLGLVAAIRQRAAAFGVEAGTSSGLEVTIDASADVEPLPAAVEVAAYRIALEALTNVARHAEARRCHISLRRTAFLELDILDDGRGLPERYRAGVGLSSMRERAAQVGGSCVISSDVPSGTLVAARLPIQALPEES